jgi:broad specificity phosphatase PhoE
MKQTIGCVLSGVLLFVGTAASVAAQAVEAPTVVVVVRHAETGMGMNQGRDPSLDEAGQARAAALIDVAGAADVKAVISSQFNRTQETAAPLAKHFGLAVTTMEVSGSTLATYPEQVAARVLAEHRGETVVVVNHSNTVPRIVEALGGASVPDIAEDVYDLAFIVVVPAVGPVRTLTVRYGS